jgi:hypothetical protein
MRLRLFLFCILLFLLTLLPLWLFILCALWYALQYDGYELIVLGVLADAFYGSYGLSVPYYLLSTSALVLTVVWLRPRLLLYNR